jgi:hypothetical protein
VSSIGLTCRSIASAHYLTLEAIKIGSVALLLASEGAYVFITVRRHKELEEAVTSIGSNVTWEPLRYFTKFFCSFRNRRFVVSAQPETRQLVHNRGDYEVKQQNFACRGRPHGVRIVAGKRN